MKRCLAIASVFVVVSTAQAHAHNTACDSANEVPSPILALIVAYFNTIYAIPPTQGDSTFCKTMTVVLDNEVKYGRGRIHMNIVSSVGMAPTLEKGDAILSISVGYGRVPTRGDVVLFRHGQTTWVKRIVGLPGERVQMVHGVLHLNDSPVVMARYKDVTGTNHLGQPARIARYRETLPDGASYMILKEGHNGPLDNTPVYVVPANSFFLMGDNRDNSFDSRVPPEAQGPGFVAARDIVSYTGDIAVSKDTTRIGTAAQPGHLKQK